MLKRKVGRDAGAPLAEHRLLEQGVSADADGDANGRTKK